MLGLSVEGAAPNTGQKDAVDASQLDVDFEAEVRNGLGGRLVDVLGLHALRCQAKHYVAHPLHLGCVYVCVHVCVCVCVCVCV